MLLQEHPRLFHIATKEQSCHNRGGHHRCIAHLALSILTIFQAFHTRYGYNLAGHGFLCFFLGVVTATVADTPWIFVR
jgi:hypothetical protein